MPWPTLDKRKQVTNFNFRGEEAGKIRQALIDARLEYTDNAVVDVMYYAHVTDMSLDDALEWRLRQGEKERASRVR